MEVLAVIIFLLVISSKSFARDMAKCYHEFNQTLERLQRDTD